MIFSIFLSFWIVEGIFGSTLDIAIRSGRTQVTILVGDDPVLHHITNGNMTLEQEIDSLYVIVLSQHDGTILAKRNFRTRQHGHSMVLHPFLESLADGRIVVFGILADASLNMPVTTRNLLLKFGIGAVQFLDYRNYLAAVVVVGGKTIAETASLDDYAIATGTYASPVMLEVSLELMPKNTCKWASENLRRNSFCSRYEGYGKLCDCDDPEDLSWALDSNLKERAVVAETMTVVIASNRPTALYRCLITILKNAKGLLEKLLVSVDGKHEEVISLLQILNVNYVINDRKNQVFPGIKNVTSFKISTHYVFSLERAFLFDSDATRAIVIEEDFLVSPDFFSYFNQTSWLLDEDESLYCISAWNDLGAFHTSRDRRKLLRIETHPGCGFMITKKFFMEIVDEWKAIKKDHDWDIWFRSPHIRAGRECVIPSVSRTFHFGANGGSHVNEVMTLAHFMGHLASSSSENVKFDTRKMTRTEYERELYRELESPDIVYINSTLHPCRVEFLPKNFTDAPIIVSFEMLSSEDYTAWARLGGCHGLWQMDSRGHHRGLFQFTYYKTIIYAIGFPFSDYSYLIPPKVHVIRPFNDKQEQQELSSAVVGNRKHFRVPDLEKFAPSILVQGVTPVPIYQNGKYNLLMN